MRQKLNAAGAPGERIVSLEQLKHSLKDAESAKRRINELALVSNNIQNFANKMQFSRTVQQDQNSNGETDLEKNRRLAHRLN